MAQNRPQRRHRSFWQRLFLLVFLPLLLLVALVVVYESLAAQQAITAGDPGELLYAAGFDGFEDEWQQAAGLNAMQIQDGQLRINVDSPQTTIYSAAEPIFADFDVSVSATAVGGSEANEGFGLVFRLEENVGGCTMPLRLLCDLSELDLFGVPLRLMFPSEGSLASRYQVFLISTDGYYALWGTDDNGIAQRLTVWHPAPDLINMGLNATNRLRVVGEGDHFQFFINGQQVELCVPLPGEQPTGNAANCLGEVTSVWQGEVAPTGKLGVVVNVDRLPGTVVEFDEFVVFQPRAQRELTSG